MSGVEPQVLYSDPQRPDAEVVAAAAAALGRGELIVLPTDTVYGIACRADDEAIVLRLFEAKQRPLTKALPLLLPGARALRHVAAEISYPLQHLARRYWPGPLTIIINKCAAVPDAVTAGRPTVGVRVPDLPLTVAILAQCPFPVAATSANLSDGTPACEIGELSPELLAAVSLVVDAGRCRGLSPSTVVDVTVRPAQVLRSGPITGEQIRAVLRE